MPIGKIVLAWKLDDEANPHEARFLKLDISKAKDKLNWTQNGILESTIKRIVDWNTAFNRQENMRREHCINEIKSTQTNERTSNSSTRNHF